MDDIYLGLHLFNDAGQFLSPVESVQSLSFAGEAGDTFFLAVNGINPIVSDINPPTLIDWDLENLAGLTVVTDYTITLEYNNETPTSVPEPASILSIALIGGLTCLNRRPKEG
ncbi:MAG: PEP-CTERM sorting domain-containing protein [Cyanobacteria bacterium P01_F01_bin.116]